MKGFEQAPIENSDSTIETIDNSPEKKHSEEENMWDILQDVIDNRFEVFNVDTMADYDADFSGSEPLFINIWNKKPGSGLGYVVFHDFLRRVGTGKTFLSTDFTGPGVSLFKKASNAGLIKQVSEPTGLQRLTKWEVTGDPVANMEKMRDSCNKNSSTK
ncbi:MAG: hypothetical protein NTZ13_02340 [Candidatus Parcubacteria bacterium]|nr:hypothetical protein [Candidatus Parcubacteria bacterium]